MVEAWDFAMGSSRRCILLRASSLATSWIIWKERNDRCFEGLSIIDSLEEKINFHNRLGVSTLSAFRSFLIGVIVGSWHEIAFSSALRAHCHSSWKPSLERFIKMNFDGSVIPRPYWYGWPYL